MEGAALERARLLWERDAQHDAMLLLQEVLLARASCLALAPRHHSADASSIGPHHARYKFLLSTDVLQVFV